MRVVEEEQGRKDQEAKGWEVDEKEGLGRKVFQRELDLELVG